VVFFPAPAKKRARGERRKKRHGLSLFLPEGEKKPPSRGSDGVGGASMKIHVSPRLKKERGPFPS